MGTINPGAATISSAAKAQQTRVELSHGPNKELGQLIAVANKYGVSPDRLTDSDELARATMTELVTTVRDDSDNEVASLGEVARAQKQASSATTDSIFQGICQGVGVGALVGLGAFAVASHFLKSPALIATATGIAGLGALAGTTLLVNHAVVSDADDYVRDATNVYSARVDITKADVQTAKGFANGGPFPPETSGF